MKIGLWRDGASPQTNFRQSLDEATAFEEGVGLGIPTEEGITPLHSVRLQKECSKNAVFMAWSEVVRRVAPHHLMSNWYKNLVEAFEQDVRYQRTVGKVGKRASLNRRSYLRV